MANYLKPQSPLHSKENDAYFYPLTTSDQVILPDGSRLNQDKLEAMILETATPDAIGALSMELLWENASPTSEFAAQTIALDLHGASCFVIEIKNNTSGNTFMYKLCKAGSYADINVSLAVADTAQRYSISNRTVFFGTDSVTFQSSMHCYNGVAGYVANNILIPTRIFAFKGGI